MTDELGPTPKERSPGLLLDPDRGAPRPFTEEGVSNGRLAPVISPDGSRLVARDPEGHSRAYPLDGGPPEPIPGVEDGEPPGPRSPPDETAGLRLSWVYLTPNGRYWVYSYARLLTDLYAAQRIR